MHRQYLSIPPPASSRLDEPLAWKRLNRVGLGLQFIRNACMYCRHIDVCTSTYIQTKFDRVLHLIGTYLCPIGWWFCLLTFLRIYTPMIRRRPYHVMASRHNLWGCYRLHSLLRQAHNHVYPVLSEQGFISSISTATVDCMSAPRSKQGAK